jgi:hypothetical protein
MRFLHLKLLPTFNMLNRRFSSMSTSRCWQQRLSIGTRRGRRACVDVVWHLFTAPLRVTCWCKKSTWGSRITIEPRIQTKVAAVRLFKEKFHHRAISEWVYNTVIPSLASIHNPTAWQRSHHESNAAHEGKTNAENELFIIYSLHHITSNNRTLITLFSHWTKTNERLSE